MGEYSSATTAQDQDGLAAWPGLPLTYGFIPMSYDLALKRYEAVEGRLNNLIAVAAGLITGVPALAKAVLPGIGLQSWWFYAAALCAAVVAIGSAWAKAYGEVKLLDIGVLSRPSWRVLSEEEFRWWAVHFAADAFGRNLDLVNRKGNAAVVLTFIFLLEVGALGLWLTFALGA